MSFHAGTNALEAGRIIETINPESARAIGDNKPGHHRAERVSILAIAAENNARAFLQHGLNTLPEIFIAVIRANFQEIRDHIRDAQPHIILLHLQPPGLEEIKSLAPLRRLFPQTPVVIFASLNSETILWQALLAGARGYLIQPVSITELHAALRETMNGGAPLCPKARRLLINGLQPRGEAGGNRLTSRQLAVMAGLLARRSAKEMATASGLSVRTIQTAIQRLYLKLHAHSAKEAIDHYLHSI